MSCNKKMKPTNSNREKLTMEAELSALGATNPSLWMSLFDVSQAIYGSKPMPRMSEWKPVYGTVQDLYRMSLKDPREFAVAQTLMTIMHQQQMKEEIIDQLPKTKPTAVSSSDEQSVSQQLNEMRREIELMSYRVNEQLKSYGALQRRLDGLQQTAKSIQTPLVKVKQEYGIQQKSVPTICLIRTEQRDWEKYLTDNCSTLYPEPRKLLDLYDGPSHVDKKSLYAKAQEYADPGVPPAVVFILSIMAKGDFKNMKFSEPLHFLADVIHQTYFNFIPVDPCVQLVIQKSLRKSRLYDQ